MPWKLRNLAQDKRNVATEASVDERSFSEFFFFFFFLAALVLRCCVWAFSSCGERGLLFVMVLGLLPVVASLVAEHRLYTCRL